MEKNLKKVRIIAISLIVILLSIIAFCGLYVKQYGVWVNRIPNFRLGMELKGQRELHFVLDDSEEEKEVYLDEQGNYSGVVVKDSSNTSAELVSEDGEKIDSEKEENKVEGYTTETRTIKANEPEAVNIENFELAKKVIQSRLEKLDVYEYNIRLDNQTGEVVIEVPDDENLEIEQSLISTVGNIEVIDAQTGVILIDNSHIEKSTLLANSSNGYQAYLQLAFDKEGTSKLKEISNNYQSKKLEDGTEDIKKISIVLDNQTISTTYFAEELPGGIIQIPMGKSTTEYSEYVEIAKSVKLISDIINSDSMPLKYTLSSDNFIKSGINDDTLLVAKIISVIAIVVISICLVVKYKMAGVKASLLAVGYIALISIIVRYTNVIITVNSLITLVSIVIVNYWFNIKFLSEKTRTLDIKGAFGDSMKSLYLAIIPLAIIAVIFTFMSSVVISSIGMILFWGLFVQAIYDCLLLV